MAIQIDLKIDTSKINAFLAGLPDNVLQKATARSLNRTMLTIRQITRVDIASKLKIKSSELTKGLEIVERAKSNQPVEDQQAVMRVSGKPQSLMNFRPQQTPLGVNVNIKGTTKLIRHAFIATMPNGGAGVFIRKNLVKPGTIMRRVGDNRSQLPIQKLYTTRIADVFTDQKGRYLTEGQAQLNKEMRTNFNFYYEQYLKS
jgi:hypothetical protein